MQAGDVLIGQVIEQSVDPALGGPTYVVPPSPTASDAPRPHRADEAAAQTSFPFLSGRTLLLLIFLWPWVFIPICFILFYGYHSKYYYRLEGLDQVPTISVSGSKPPSSILFAYGLHFEAVLLAVFFVVLYHLYHEKIDSYYDTDRALIDEVLSPASADDVEAARQATEPPVVTTAPPPSAGSSAASLRAPMMRNVSSSSSNQAQPSDEDHRRDDATARLLSCEGYYRYWINACECATCYGCQFFQCACCYCDYLAFDDHFQHNNPDRYPLLRSYLHHWNRVCLGVGLFAAWCMTMVGSIDLGVNETAHGVFAFLMFVGGVAHEVFFFYHVTRHVGSVQRRSLFPIFCHQLCLVLTLPFNLLVIVVTGIVYAACGHACHSFVFNMFPALEFTTILFVLLYVLSFYDEFARVTVVTTVNHHWKNL
eukprot:gene4430-3165_t